MTHIQLMSKNYDFFMFLGFNSNHEVKKTAYQKWRIPFRAILDRDSRLRLFLTTVSYIFIGRTIFSAFLFQLRNIQVFYVFMLSASMPR